MKAVAETLGVSRSNLIERLARGAKPRRRYQKAQDAAVLPLVRRLVDARPTYGYRRITALLLSEGWSVNPKRVERIWRREGLKVPHRQPKRGRLWLADGGCVPSWVVGGGWGADDVGGSFAGGVSRPVEPFVK